MPGRLECVASLNNNSNIIVDFAHTPEALKQSLITLKKQFKYKKYSHNRFKKLGKRISIQS